jgi:hypothetical protein
MRRRSLHVQLGRLQASKVLIRYAQGLYGAAHAEPDELMSCLDPGAYLTGHAALFRHGLATQVPTVLTCFTNKRHGRSRICRTPAAVFEFVTPARPLYRPPAPGRLVAPEQALCDFVFTCSRRGARAENLVTFRSLGKLSGDALRRVLPAYSKTVQKQVARILGNAGK